MATKFNGVIVETNSGVRTIAGGGTGATTAATALDALGGALKVVPTFVTLNSGDFSNGVYTVTSARKLNLQVQSLPLDQDSVLRISNTNALPNDEIKIEIGASLVPGRTFRLEFQADNITDAEYFIHQVWTVSGPTPANIRYSGILLRTTGIPPSRNPLPREQSYPGGSPIILLRTHWQFNGAEILGFIPTNVANGVPTLASNGAIPLSFGGTGATTPTAARENLNAAANTNFAGATSSAAGTAGLVPAPILGDQDKYLKADGTWATIQGGGAGQDGADGNTVLNGTVSPTTQGVDGDFYINTTTNQIFGPKTSGSWGSGVNLIGESGNKWFYGVGAPVTVTGASLGDFYLESTGAVYRRESISGGQQVWNYATSIKGPANELTIGTVTQGQPAAATITGQAGSQTLNLTLPIANAVLNGTSDPAGSTGTPGDFYINTTAKTIFGPKAITGVWPFSTSLVGPQGAPGGVMGFGPLTISRFQNSVFQNSGFAGTNGTPGHANNYDLGTASGMFPVTGNVVEGWFANDTSYPRIFNPARYLGTSVSYRITMYVRVNGAFNDGIHCQLRINIAGAVSNYANLILPAEFGNLRRFGGGNTNLADRIYYETSNTLTTADQWIQYVPCFAAYGTGGANNNGATIQDVVLFFYRV
jgi:hypothetical protein